MTEGLVELRVRRKADRSAHAVMNTFALHIGVRLEILDPRLRGDDGGLVAMRVRRETDRSAHAVMNTCALRINVRLEILDPARAGMTVDH